MSHCFIFDKEMTNKFNSRVKQILQYSQEEALIQVRLFGILSQSSLKKRCILIDI